MSSYEKYTAESSSKYSKNVEALVFIMSPLTHGENQRNLAAEQHSLKRNAQPKINSDDGVLWFQRQRERKKNQIQARLYGESSP